MAGLTPPEEDEAQQPSRSNQATLAIGQSSGYECQEPKSKDLTAATFLLGGVTFVMSLFYLVFLGRTYSTCIVLSQGTTDIPFVRSYCAS